MAWHYQIMKHTEEDGEVWFGLHEYYLGDDDTGDCWTKNPVKPFGETEGDILYCLEMMLIDAKQYGVKDYE